jgi:hypothetical protein
MRARGLRVRAHVTSLQRAAWIAAAWLLGCQAPVAELEGLELDASDARQGPGFEHIPDGVRPTPAPPEPEPEPEPELEPGDSPRFVVRGPVEDGPCWQVDAVGMPAVDDAGVVATVSSQHLQMSSFPGPMELQLLDENGILEHLAVIPDDTTFYDREADDEEADRQCRKLVRLLRAKATAANALLAHRRWRAMEKLPAQTWIPEVVPMERYRAEIPVDERPVQVTHRWGRVVARVVGVELLESEPTRGKGPIIGVWGDRDSGVVALLFGECAGDSCTCDPAYTFAVHRWSDETLAAFDDRPCIATEEEHEEGEGCDLTWQTPTADHDPFAMSDW